LDLNLKPPTGLFFRVLPICFLEYWRPMHPLKIATVLLTDGAEGFVVAAPGSAVVDLGTEGDSGVAWNRDGGADGTTGVFLDGGL
jgi:hypothetical protein